MLAPILNNKHYFCKNKLMNVILTGVTGTLGSQILYQLLQNEGVKTIFLLIRKKGKVSGNTRLKSIINNSAAPKWVAQNKSRLLKKIVVLESSDFLNPSQYLSKSNNNFLIHSAGCVNLSTDIAHKEMLYQENLEFTKTIFEAFSSFIAKFTYISTAFSIGDIGGIIDNDYHNKKPQFRNFYEASKHATETFLRKKGLHLDLKIQILRPSVLGGNIFQDSKYFISKYMVYYLVGKFFYNKIVTKETKIRLALNSKTGLNIVPVDYVAKVIAKVFTEDITQLNIVQRNNTNVLKGMKKIIDAVGFENYTFINTSDANFVLDAKNKLEDIYYKTIGLHLNKYITSNPYEFDTKLLESIVPMPLYNTEEYLTQTIQYAKNNKFKNAW